MLQSIAGVLYFDLLLGAVHTQKLVETLFSAVFNLFCSFQTFFGDFKAEITEKHLKMNKKMYFAYSSKLVDMQKLVDSLRRVPRNCLFLVRFLLFFNIFQHFATDFDLFSLIFNFFESN